MGKNAVSSQRKRPKLHTGESKGMEPVPVHRRLLNGWMAIVARFGFVQTLVILGIFYALLIGPVAIVGALTRRDLLDKRGLGSGDTAWRESESAAADFERAKQMT